MDVNRLATFEHDVALADGERLVVNLLSIGDDRHLVIACLVEGMNLLFENGQCSACACAGIICFDDTVRLGEIFFCTCDEELRCKGKAIARREVLAGSLVGDFGKLADELFVDIAHLRVGDGFRTEVRLGLAETVDNIEEEIVLVKFLDDVVNTELVEYVQHIRRETCDVVDEIVFNVVGLIAEGLHGEL